MTREEAISKLNRLRNEYNEQYIDYCGTNEAVDMAIQALQSEPIKHGRWIDADDSKLHCTSCHRYIRRIVPIGYDYCPYCGAKMDKPEGQK